MGAPAIPYAGRTIIALAHDQFVAIRRTVELLFRIAHTPAYREVVDADADPSVRFAPGNFGVFMGYDFHVTPAGPRLVEVNTNAGGALLNGLHTAALCEPARLACLCADLMPVETISERIVRTFLAEFEAVRGAGARPDLVAIADERPREQFLYPEFELFALAVRAGGDPRGDLRHQRARARAGTASLCAGSASISSTCATPTSRCPRHARPRCARPISRAGSS